MKNYFRQWFGAEQPLSPSMPKAVEIKKPPLYFEETQSLLEQLETSLDADVFVYWMSRNSHIVQEDIVTFYEVLRKVKKRDKLCLFIKSGGGNGRASLRFINLFREYYKNVTALVPLDCASAATMLVLGADEIFMGPLAYLSAIDTSITHDLSPLDKENDRVSVSQNELERVLKLWSDVKQPKDTNPYNELYKYIHPLVFGAVDRASLLSIKTTTDILSYHMTDNQKAEDISRNLNSNYPSHSYPIMLREAKRLGLNAKEISTELNTILLRMNELYSNMTQSALTDYDESSYHDNEIMKFVEGRGIQFYFQTDKDMHYRKEERRWIPMNDESSWRLTEKTEGETKKKNYYIR
ncbi:MAG: hypothetical protein RLZZ292_2893 [Bacteroidota bacterium]|jgi:hypothetical protein